MSETIAHRHVAILRVSEPKVLDELAAVVALEEYVLARVSETEIVVDPSRVGQLASALAERGMAPLMKRGKNAGRRKPRHETSRTPVRGEVDEPTVALHRNPLYND